MSKEQDLYLIYSATGDCEDVPETICAVYGEKVAYEVVDQLNIIISEYESFICEIEYDNEIDYYLSDGSKLSAKVRRKLNATRIAMNKILTVNGYKSGDITWHSFRWPRYYVEKVMVRK